MAEIKETDPAVADSSHESHEADANWGNPSNPTKEEDKASNDEQAKAFESYENRSDIESRESIHGRYSAAPGEYSVSHKERGDKVPGEAPKDEKETEKRSN